MSHPADIGDGSLLFSWSTGKDSAYALHLLRKTDPAADITLLTTCASDYGRVSMHGVRNELLEKQREAIGLPLHAVSLPVPCSGEEYESIMRGIMEDYRRRGYTTVAFGDIFLEDLRVFREERMKEAGMRALFPVWGHETAALAREIISAGFSAIVTCVDTQSLDESFAGRMYDNSFLADLPASVDPCGENGEFHTFAFNGPIFSKPVEFQAGEKVTRDGRFRYCDLLPR